MNGQPEASTLQKGMKVLYRSHGSGRLLTQSTIWSLGRLNSNFALDLAAILEMKSDLFEALETLRARYLDEEWQRKQSKIRKWTGYSRLFQKL